LKAGKKKKEEEAFWFSVQALENRNVDCSIGAIAL
jgi:hypothetical protein